MTVTASKIKRGDHIVAGRVYVAVEAVRSAAGRMVEVTVRGGGRALFHADELLTVGARRWLTGRMCLVMRWVSCGRFKRS